MCSMYVLLLFQSCSRFYRAGIGIVKKIGFTYVLAKSPIIHLKMLFPKPPKSDSFKGLEHIQKKHLERCIFKNGARYCAIIGLKIMRILSG